MTSAVIAFFHSDSDKAALCELSSNFLVLHTCVYALLVSVRLRHVIVMLKDRAVD